MASFCIQDMRHRQLQKLRLLMESLKNNAFYQEKFAGGFPSVNSLASFINECPFTEKAELVADQQAHPPHGNNHSYPIEAFTRFHQTSGSTGTPMRWMDTPEDWAGMVGSWVEIMEVVGLGPKDRCFFAFSFGPFLGFWTAFEAGCKLGALCIPGGGMRTSARLRTILDNGVTALFCTPTYAIHMGQVAAAEGLDMSQSQVGAIVVAGEPGGSLPETRNLIQDLWPGAKVYDHHGMTEVGPVSLPCPQYKNRLHIMEHAYLAEIVDPETGRHTLRGNPGELILTTLGRKGSPLLRYRTGDLVKAPMEEICACGRAGLALDGGILGRIDQMVVVRGVNLYPSAVEEIVRRFGGIDEFQVEINDAGGLRNITITAEFADSSPGIEEALARAFNDALQLRVDVKRAESGSLPRFELKAKRWHVR